MGLIERIQGKRIYLDTNVFVYVFEGFDPYISLLRPVIERIDRGELHSVTSELTLAEILVKPLQEKMNCGRKYINVEFKRHPRYPFVRSIGTFSLRQQRSGHNTTFNFPTPSISPLRNYLVVKHF